MGRASAAAVAMALALACAQPSAADPAGLIVLDVGFSFLGGTVTAGCAYVTPRSWVVSAAVGGMYLPSIDAAALSGMSGYRVEDVVIAELAIAAGYSFSLGRSFSLVPCLYAGMRIFGSRDSLSEPAYGIESSDDRVLAAFRAGFLLDARWYVYRSFGLHVRLGLPWQLFKFSTLGLAEASELISVEAGLSWRIPLG